MAPGFETPKRRNFENTDFRLSLVKILIVELSEIVARLKTVKNVVLKIDVEHTTASLQCYQTEKVAIRRLPKGSSLFIVALAFSLKISIAVCLC